MTSRARQSLSGFDAVFLMFVFILSANIPEMIQHLGGPPPVLTQVLFVGFAVFLLLARTIVGLPVLHREGTEIMWPFAIWLFAWFVTSTIGLLASSMSDVAIQVFVDRSKMALIAALLMVLLLNFTQPKLVGATLALAAVMAAITTIGDFVTPTFTGVPGRGAGFFLNPNTAGFMMILLCLSGLPVLPPALRWPYVLLIAVAVFLTFSRSSWVLLFFTISALFWQGELGFRKQRLALGLLAILGVAGLGMAIMTGALVDLILATPLADFLDSNTLARLGLAEFASDQSANERADVANLALNFFLDGGHPIFGYGLGYTHIWEFRVSTHNMYLLYLVEGGLVGLVIYLSLIVLLISKTHGIARLMAVNLSIYSLFSHNILDSPSRITMIVVLLTLSYVASTEKTWNKAPGMRQPYA